MRQWKKKGRYGEGWDIELDGGKKAMEQRKVGIDNIMEMDGKIYRGLGEVSWLRGKGWHREKRGGRRIGDRKEVRSKNKLTVIWNVKVSKWTG